MKVRSKFLLYNYYADCRLIYNSTYFKHSTDSDNRIKKEFVDSELTVFKKLQYNFAFYAASLPDLWSMSRLPLGKDDLIIFSKESTIVDDTGALMIMFEKSVVFHKNGSVHYSVHGKDLKTKHPSLPACVASVGLLFKTISVFNMINICMGICTKEFEVDKDQFVFKDDLGYCRHISCSLITDENQCIMCYQYSQ